MHYIRSRPDIRSDIPIKICKTSTLLLKLQLYNKALKSEVNDGLKHFTDVLLHLVTKYLTMRTKVKEKNIKKSFLKFY